MIRTPLRPLARILAAREKGENPDAIERENIRQRHETMRDRARIRAEGRLFLLGATFFMAFAVVGARMGLLAATEPMEPEVPALAAPIIAERADITGEEVRPPGAEEAAGDITRNRKRTAITLVAVFVLPKVLPAPAPEPNK